MPVTRHAGASHHHRLRPVLFFELTPNLDHALERPLPARRLRNRHVERALAGKPIDEPHLAQITHVARD